MISKIDQLIKSLEKDRVDSILLQHPANISYLTGFSTQDSYLLLNNRGCFLITDSRYSAEYQNLLKSNQIKIIEINESFVGALTKLTKKLKIKNLAFEQNYISFYLYQKLKAAIHKKLIPTKNIVENLRAIKEPQELALIKKAVSITLSTFEYIKKVLKPGIKEIEIASEIERHIRLNGASQASFDIIVASGPNSSYPHAKITERKIKNNEPILIDMGVDYNGYKSDLTRVFFLGKINPLFKKVYNTVKTAQQLAKKFIRPGVAIEYIDKQARGYIDKEGFKNCFKHSLGHGIGLETHELPRIASKNKQKLKTGMVFTLEPAIYLSNKFGVRIEDMVLVTSTGAEVLSGS